jgi:hypothetical protein
MTVTRRLLLSIIPAAAAPLLGVPERAWADADLTRAERSIGKPDAKVSVHEYFSLTCTHCAAFAQTTLPQVKAKLIDPGSVRWVFHDYPLDQVALTAAMVARYLPRLQSHGATVEDRRAGRHVAPGFRQGCRRHRAAHLDPEAAAGRSGQMEDRLDSELRDRRSEIRWGNGLRGLSKTDPRVNTP